MTVEEIEKAAARNEAVPKNLTAPQLCLFTTLRALYLSYYSGMTDKESARLEKKLALSGFNGFESERMAWTLAAKHYQQNIRRAGTLLSDIEKSKDTTEMILLSAEAIGLMTGDEGFRKRIAKKLEGV